MRLYLLGPPRLDQDGLSIKVETRKTLALLAFLALSGEGFRRDSLVNLLWPDYDMTHGRGVLRRTLSALNDILPTGWIIADRETIGLGTEADLWLDVKEFERLLAECQAHHHPAETVCPDCQILLSQAVELYHGDFMTGFSLPDSYNFDDWQFFQAEGLRQKLDAMLKKLVRCLVLREDFPRAIEQARRRLELDRLNETAHCDLMQLYAWNGQRSAALRQFQECKNILLNQLTQEPQAATRELFRAIENGQLPAPPSDPAWAIGEKSEARPKSKPFDKPPGGTTLPEVEEKRLLSVLVCLVARSQSGGDSPGSEEGKNLFEEFYSIARPILEPYGGQIEHSLGGSILIAFGLDRSHENDPELALRAALDILPAVKRAGISISAGISCGEVYIQRRSRSGIMDYQLEGSPIDLAMLFARQADPDQILAGESLYQLCRQTFAFTRLPPLIQRNGAHQTVYRLGSLLVNARKTRGADNFHALMVGRERELDLLVQAVDTLKTGQGQMLAIVGEAGVGKSRMIEELRIALQASQQPPLWLEGRCLELSIDVSYWPFIDLLRDYCTQQGSETTGDEDIPVATSIHKLVATGVMSSSHGDDMIPLFQRMLGLKIDPDQTDALMRKTPEEIRQQTFMALRDFLLAICQLQPVVLVFEDLHWADRLTLDLISLLMESLEEHPLFLLCVYRPDQEYRTFHLSQVADRKCHDRFREFRLSELSRRQCDLLIDALLAPGQLPSNLKSMIWDRCQGNPFFIEETLQFMVATGLLSFEQGLWKTQPVDGSQLSTSLQSTILSRLDHLSEDWRSVLQTGAVIGRIFSRRLLQEVLRAEVNLDTVLWELEGRGLIYQERAFPDVEYSFRHALMQEAIYHSILRHRRRIIHQRAAEAIQTLFAPNLGDHIEELAHHFEKSGDIQNAIVSLYQAGVKARNSYANEAAIAYLTKGLELLRSLPESIEHQRKELDYLLLMGVPLVHARGHADSQVLKNYQEARDLCIRLGDSKRLFDALLGLRRYFLYHGQLTASNEVCQEMLALAETHGAPGEQTRARMMLAELLWRQGQYPAALEISQQGIAISADLDPRDSVLAYGNESGIGCRVIETIALWHAGWPDQARRSAERQLALSAGLAHPFSREYTLYVSAAFYIQLQDSHTVLKLAEEELHIANEHGFILYQNFAACQMGWALARQGDVKSGLEWLYKGISGLQALQFGLALEITYAHLAEVLLLAGQVVESLKVIDQGLNALKITGACELKPELLRLRAEAALREKRLADAEASFQQAIQTARRQSSRAWELRAALGLARLWKTEEKHAAAYNLLRPLLAAYTEGWESVDLQTAHELLNQLETFSPDGKTSYQ